MRFLRIWQELDLEDIKKHLLVIGELSAECFNCHELGIDSTSRSCPSCGTVFKYIGFRRRLRPADFKSFKQERAGVKLIDFFDFKKAISKENARDIFK
ncbi:MAG: hypothetical protein K9L95_05855 [Candidatus Omnitrophica bacterium]|nr:hypothetical protein [Candidatus Omnitrophota bacterium]MCF7878968.1 hypothetical protein [Candidatus Omnitrophota bacterium]MCF7893257.1 hypothetical protein [Candidatus Omnitrophota bacterium]